jgi:sporulation protein YlmC with PRC-barrel domain
MIEERSMQSNQTTHKWSDIYKMDVVVPEMGKSLGKVEDFYFQEGTNAIYALSVRTRLHGDLSLPVTGIVAIEKDRVTIRNQQMLTKAIPPFTRGQKLLTRKVLGENGTTVGDVKDLLLGIDPPFTMWVIGFEIIRGSKGSTFSADGIARYDDEANTLVIHDQVAKKLR